MKNRDIGKSGHREIGTSEDREDSLTAETRRRGGESGHRDIGKSGHREIGTSGDRKSGDHPITRDVSRLAVDHPISRFRRAWNVLRATLSEIFDESAYERFLQLTCTSRSKQSYDEFIREREATAINRPRCC